MMNEYRCRCEEYIVRYTITGMLDAVAKHMVDCPHAQAEPNAALPERPGRRPYPARALYRGDAVKVLGYAGGGDFIIIWGELQVLANRRHLTFTKS